MKSLMLLFREVLVESGTWCHTSTDRDLKSVTARFENEGVSFLTITLPQLGKDLQKALAQSEVSHDLFLAFAKTGSLPRIFGGFFDLIFDRKDGRLLDDPSKDAIRCLLQLSLMFSKVKLKCTPEREHAAIVRYIECEKEIRKADAELTSLDAKSFRIISSMLFGNVLNNLDLIVENEEFIPRHGPGSTADALTSNGKYNLLMWTTRLEAHFPFGRWVTPSWRDFLAVQDKVLFLEPGEELPVKVTLVPKTLKTPRVIAIEPTCMQYMQQALMTELYRLTEQDDICSSFVGFTKQEPNQLLALEGSLTGSLATLDLSEASDRVSNQHVRLLLANNPLLAEVVEATRSRKAVLPDGRIIRLAKFASMGSALCFPVEAMVFTTLCFLGIQKVLNRPLTMKDIKSMRGKVRVYGDDIIIPVEFVNSVVNMLETFGFRVNSSKSFWTGKFRESCGKEYYDGHDVTQTRVRHLIPSHRGQAAEIVSTVSLRNQLFVAGYLDTVRYLDTIIEGLIPFPYVTETSPALGKIEHGRFETHRVCPNLQRSLVRGVVKVDRIPSDVLDGYGALAKWFLKKGDEPFFDKNHLLRAGRPVAVDIKHRWVYSY